MRFKLTILLILLNVALFIFIFYLEKVRSASSSFTDAERLVLDPAFMRNVDTLRLESDQLDRDWVLSRQVDDKWTVISPVEWKANRYAVERLLHQLSFLRWDTRFSLEEIKRAQQGLDSYGLDPPGARLVLNSSDKQVEIAIGTMTEIGNRLYILDPEGRHIQVVHRDLLTSISRELDHFLDRGIHDIPPFEIQAIQIQSRAQGNLRTRISRENGIWQYDSPITAAADPEAMRDVLHGIYQLEVEYFPDNLPADTGLDRPNLRLTLEGMNRRETLLIGNLVDPDVTDGPRFAKRESFDAVFALKPGHLDKLERSQETLRDRRLLRHLDEQWTSVEIRMGDRGLTLQRLENGHWQVLFTNPAGVLQTLTADASEVRRLIENLRQLEAMRFVTDAPSEIDLERFGLTQPQRYARIQTTGGQTFSLRIGTLTNEESQLYLDTNQSSTVYQVRPFILNDLSLDPLQYRNRVLRTLPENSRVTELRWIDQSGETLVIDEVESIPSPMMDFATESRVERYLSIPFSNPLRIDRNRRLPWRFALEMDTQSRGSTEISTVRFLLTERLGGNRQYAVLDGENTVFNLPADVIGVLEEWTARSIPEPASPSAIPGRPDPLVPPPDEEETLPETPVAPES